MSDFTFYDCHMHCLGEQKGGILIALDGRRGSDGGYSNSEVLDVANSVSNVWPAQYITYDFPEDIITEIIKYHPRRELYSVDDVIEDIRIKRRGAKLIIVDTLNQPMWQPNDYWRLAKAFPEKQFLMSHTGGYDMAGFINMAIYQPNVWIDFSFVQHILGWSGDEQPMPIICQTIDYMLNHPVIRKKILFGSDNMINEDDHAGPALAKYDNYDCFKEVTEENYLRMIAKLHLSDSGLVEGNLG